VTTDPLDDETEAIHLWFSLSYAAYLVLNRSLLQSMPEEWQRRFVRCLTELEDHYGDSVEWPTYWVRTRDDRGRFRRDPIPHYDRGRTFIPGRTL
jgi:hypothetical protein